MLVCMYVHVWVCVCVGVYMCACNWLWACMWRPEINTRCLLQQLPTLFFETRSHWGSFIWLNWLASRLHKSACLCYQSPGVTHSCYSSWFLQGAGDLNLGPHACLLGSLSTDLSPQFPSWHGLTHVVVLAYLPLHINWLFCSWLLLGGFVCLFACLWVRIQCSNVVFFMFALCKIGYLWTVGDLCFHQI